MTTTTISPSPQQPSPSSSPSPFPAAAIPSWIVDSFVFDEYSRKVSQVSQFVVEGKFIEATQKLVEYGNRDFLRSFQLRAEIIQEQTNSGNTSNNHTNTININNINDIASSSLIAPFQTIGFLESKWLEVLKELIEYDNNNILGSFKLSLAVEKKGHENNNNNGSTGVKEVFSGVLDLKRKKEERE